ncbi:hypothetical protein E4U46_004670 [Claviceps purpurea]|nr:hypothetical protein E4U46_004670 [Claviceps purpurea]
MLTAKRNHLPRVRPSSASLFQWTPTVMSKYGPEHELSVARHELAYRRIELRCEFWVQRDGAEDDKTSIKMEALNKNTMSRFDNRLPGVARYIGVLKARPFFCATPGAPPDALEPLFNVNTGKQIQNVSIPERILLA